MTRSAGNLIEYYLKRKEALPRAVRESRDYDSAVRVRFLAESPGRSFVDCLWQKFRQS